MCIIRRCQLRLLYPLSSIHFTSSLFAPTSIFSSASATATNRVRPPFSLVRHTCQPPIVDEGLFRSDASPLLSILSVDPLSLNITSNTNKPVSHVIRQQVNGHHSISSLLLPPPPLSVFYSLSSHDFPPCQGKVSTHLSPVSMPINPCRCRRIA